VASADETLARAQSGDPDAFRDLYLAHHATLYRYALAELGTADDARDVVQETFVRAWTGLAGFRGDSSFLHWVFRIARNLVIDRARARKRRPTVSLQKPMTPDGDETLGDRIAATTGDPEAAAVSAEEQRRFRQAIAGLPGIQRSVFIMREWDGLPYEAIADRLQINVGTVRSRLARAREALADAMRATGNFPADTTSGVPGGTMA
jgi:RNA polymerase sigma-70 factor (ECF subfamily)